MDIKRFFMWASFDFWHFFMLSCVFWNRFRYNGYGECLAMKWRDLWYDKVFTETKSVPLTDFKSPSKSSKVNIYVDLIDFIEIEGNETTRKQPHVEWDILTFIYVCGLLQILIWFFSFHSENLQSSMKTCKLSFARLASDLEWFRFFIYVTFLLPISINLNLKKAKM